MGDDGGLAAGPEGPRLLPGALSWPAVRGARLLRLLTASAAAEGERPGDEPAGAPGFSVDLCVPAPGHVALVLSRPQSAADAAAVTPQVVYVMDAVPPKTASASAASSSSALSSGAAAPSPAGASATNTPTKPKGGRFSLSQAPSLQDVDELELIEELLAMPRVSGTDGAVVAKAPLLCARFDCAIVSVRFVGAEPAKAATAMTASTMSSPLRCVVAREDGMAFLWEWRADLHQWTFMNRFCFLENPNLSWTKPVVAFTATQSDKQNGGTRTVVQQHRHHSKASAHNAGDMEEEVGGRFDLVWWSTEVKQEPKLWQRTVRFVREANTFRTDAVVGSAHSILPSSCTDITKLLPSKLGLWALSSTNGVFFRSATLLSTLQASWESATTGLASDSDAAVGCIHNVTGELLILHRSSGAVFLISPPRTALSSIAMKLQSKKLTTLARWTSETCVDGDLVREIAGHRHVLLTLVVKQDGPSVLYVHSLVTGEKMDSIALPVVSTSLPPTLSSFSTKPITPLRLWVLPGKASGVGLWSSSSFWTLQLPSAKQVSTTHRVIQHSPEAAFRNIKEYGESCRLDAALFALDSLEQAITYVSSLASPPECSDHKAQYVADEEKWRSAVASMSNPALLLALLTSDSRRMPTALVDELAALVCAISSAAYELSATDRGVFSRQANHHAGDSNRSNVEIRSAVDKATILMAGRRLVTASNLEAIKHLANWVLLAKRKIVRLHSTAFLDEKPLGVASGDRQKMRQQMEGGDGDVDTSNFRLSRKLRPMSNLRFAAQSCADGSHGKQWLAQLEAFLLPNVPFKHKRQDEGKGEGASMAMPNHLLFHEERVLDDYARHGGAPSFSKHMYLESMSRLYLLHEPAELVTFVECVEKFCPRLFSLAGHANASKSHAERALALLPPLALFIQRVQDDVKDLDARESLEAYVKLLCHCGQYVEASRALLDCSMYTQCKDFVFKPLSSTGNKPGIEPESFQGNGGNLQSAEDRQAAISSVYFALVEYCVRHHDAVDELSALVAQKPPHVAPLSVLCALRSWLEAAAKSSSPETSRVTVGKLRPVLSVLLASGETSSVSV